VRSSRSLKKRGGHGDRGRRGALGAVLAALLGCGTPSQQPPVVASRAAEPPPIEAGLPASPGEYDLAVDVLHYDVELSLGDSIIRGRATLLVDPGGSSELPLDFTGLSVLSVRVDGSSVGFDYAGGKLRIPLAGAGAPRSVMVEYAGRPDDGLLLRPNTSGHPSAFVDNWPNRTRFWLPSVDHPGDKATASFTVHAPEGWEVIANGRQVTGPRPADPSALGGGAGRRTWRWETRVPQPTYTLVVGATDFTVESLGRAACGRAPASPDPDGCVDVSFWSYPDDAAFAREVFDRAPEMVDYFTDLIGPFPFEKLANVQSSTRFGGMENSSAIFYSEQAIAAGGLTEGTVSHEIAHQWFGDSATESEWSQLWLSEGFATYFGHLFFEDADGGQSFRDRMEQDRLSYIRSGVTDEPIVRSQPPSSLFDLLNANNYEKGGWVLHMLRGHLGDETFFEAIRSYYQAHRFGNATTEDLRSILEESSGQDLGWFFRQWVFRPGYPVLEVHRQWDGTAGEVVLDIVQTQPSEWPTFRLPMAVHLVSSSDRDTVEVTVADRVSTVRIPAPSRPDTVLLDPDRWILRGGPGI